uniref:Uncharacterized protein n=1 Tax=Cannabis sativa TaxID=3483 RepID=A0A803PSE3_CANSA
MMARTKKTIRKALETDLQFAWMFAAAREEQARPLNEEKIINDRDVEVQAVEDQGNVCPATAPAAEGEGKEEEKKFWVQPFCCFNKDEEPISEDGEVLVASCNYVEEEYTEARIINNHGQRGARWVSPPSVEGKGKAIVVEEEEDDSFDEDAPSLLIWEAAPVHTALRVLKKRSSDASCKKSSTKRLKVGDTLLKSIAPSTKTPKITTEGNLTVVSLDVHQGGGDVGGTANGWYDEGSHQSQYFSFHYYIQENLKENFDYLKDKKDAYLGFCKTQKSEEEAKIDDNNSSTIQEHENPIAEDLSNQYKEPGTHDV